MPESAPLGPRRNVALTPTNRAAPVGVIPSASDSIPPADGGPSLSPPPSRPALVRLPKRSAAASPRTAEPTANRRVSVRGNHRPPPAAVAAVPVAPARPTSAFSATVLHRSPYRHQSTLFLREALSVVHRRLGTPERGPSPPPPLPHVLADHQRCVLDLIRITSTLPGHPGLPSRSIPAPAERASEETQRNRTPLTHWRPPRHVRSTDRPRLPAVEPPAPKSSVGRHSASTPPDMMVFRPAHVCGKDTAGEPD